MGFVDVKGNEVVPLKYQEVSNFKEKMGKVSINGKWGMVDTSGKEVIKPKYTGIAINKGIIGINLNGKCTYLHKTGKTIIAPKYDSAY